MGCRDGPIGDERPHLDKLPSSKRRNENNTCTATTRYTEWVLPEGHRGDHEDEEGVRWPDEEAIY